MDEIIAHLHTATKSLYDRGQTVLQQATALATSAAAQTDAPTRAKINSTANAICLKARSVHVDSLSLKKEVQGHETWYPTQATFEFRLWRLMDAVGYALAKVVGTNVPFQRHIAPWKVQRPASTINNARPELLCLRPPTCQGLVPGERVEAWSLYQLHLFGGPGP